MPDTIAVEVGGRSSQSAPTCPGEMRVYRRLAGGIQWLYTLIFGRYAIDLLSYCYHPAIHFKDVDDPAYLDRFELFLGLNCALIAFSGLVAGYGLLRLRPWVRRWEAAYLGALSLAAAVVGVAMLFDIHVGLGDLAALGLFFLAFAVPYVPFLFWSVGDRIVATPLDVPGKKKVVSAFGGVSDQALDG